MLTEEEFKKQVLLNKTQIDTHKEVQQLFNPTPKINVRDFMCCYLFAFYNYCTDDNLTNVSKRLVSEITQQNYCHQTYAEYEDLYMKWKEKDMLETLQGLMQMYWEIQICIETYRNEMGGSSVDPSIEHHIQLLTKKSNDILNTMKRIDNLSYFKSFTPVAYDDQVIDSVQNTLRKAYWDKMKNEVLNHSVDSLTVLLKEIKNTIIYVTNNNSKIISDVDNHLYINQEIVLKTDPDFWKSKCIYLHSLLEQLDSVAKLSDHREFWSHWLSSYSDAEISTKYTLCIDYLQYFMDNLLEIKQFKDDWQALTK